MIDGTGAIDDTARAMYTVSVLAYESVVRLRGGLCGPRQRVGHYRQRDGLREREGLRGRDGLHQRDGQRRGRHHKYAIKNGGAGDID